MTLFNWNDVKVAYFSLHLLAYPTEPDRCAKREGQAKVIEEEIKKRVNEGYEIIVIGDFNDYDDDYDYDRLQDQLMKNKRVNKWSYVTDPERKPHISKNKKKGNFGLKP